jgi:hypothetical protein
MELLNKVIIHFIITTEKLPMLDMMRLLAVLGFLHLSIASFEEDKSQKTNLYAIHFPQFHEDDLNNEIWGKGVSDWTNLNLILVKSSISIIMKVNQICCMNKFAL